jgi:hypothetical protein
MKKLNQWLDHRNYIAHKHAHETEKREIAGDVAISKCCKLYLPFYVFTRALVHRWDPYQMQT